VIPVFSAAGKRPLYVTLDTAELREKPSAVSKKVGTMHYGDMVLVLEEKKNWSFVCSYEGEDSVQGWLPSSALTKKKILTAGNKNSADADEIALAGKGFNSTIESVYADEFEIDYSDVDYVESQYVSDELVIQFIEEGKLFLGGPDYE